MDILPALTVDNSQAQSTSTSAYVLVRHPGYHDANRSNVLLELNAVDWHAGIHGIQAALVHTACAIIAANRWDGWLSISKDPSAGRIDHLRIQVLEVGSYYFHVSPDSQSPSGIAAHTPYPIVPNFAEWSFPDGGLPEVWTRPAIAPEPGLDTTTRARDISCRVTQCVDVTEEAHIVPKSEVEWFAMNGMGLYNRSSSRHGQDRIDGPQNRLLLRQDIHTAWDRMYFSIVPKPSAALAGPIRTVAVPTTATQQHEVSQSSWHWTYHLHASRGQLHTTFHNHVLHSLNGISRESLFARFAWTMFPMIHQFLQCGVARWVSLRRRSDEDIDVARLAGGPECKTFCENQGRFRSASPRKKSGSPSKRQRSTDDQSTMQFQSKRQWHHRSRQKRMSFTDTEGEMYADGDESSNYGHSCSFTTQATSIEDCTRDESTTPTYDDLHNNVAEEDEDPCGFKRRRQVYEEEGEGGDHWSLMPASLEESRGRKRRR